jgi:hypothetical protein
VEESLECRHPHLPQHISAAYVPLNSINYGEISDSGLYKECIVADCKTIHNLEPQITSLHFGLRVVCLLHWHINLPRDIHIKK